MNAYLLRRLLKARSGTAATEMALALPFLLTIGMWGTELANQMVTRMRLSQLAMQIADNASRIGDQSMLSNRKIYESDVDDLLAGAKVQASTLDLYTNGRVIVSSLEVVPGTTSTQYIHWQRCRGLKKVTSAYGGEGTGKDGSLVGMGPSGEEAKASSGDAVMFVELTYDYQPLISNLFTGGSQSSTIKVQAAFNVRDDRDLTQIYQRDTSKPDPVASCSSYTT
ncbi:pilus assembly protein [Novosphingobium olei]|uniref:TadE/TadG family type IV pilus assembly protein n=1 Tax=Novosphingobium olei TaxID=2728851 RepID=UPI00308748C4|nr:pilus assembly protein [Novosphingobium olei]